jgi:hypothetical protein
MKEVFDEKQGGHIQGILTKRYNFMTSHFRTSLRSFGIITKLNSLNICEVNIAVLQRCGLQGDPCTMELIHTDSVLFFAR